MGDFDLDISFFPGFGLKLLPLHVANGVLVVAKPSLELVVVGHCCAICAAFTGVSTVCMHFK